MAINISKLRGTAGAITYDPGYANTGSCLSTVTFVDGEKGILKYRGYKIEDLAEKASFLEVIYLVVYEKLPNKAELDEFDKKIRANSVIPEGMKTILDGIPKDAHPMATLSIMLTSLATYFPFNVDKPETVEDATIKLLGMIRTLSAYGFRKSRGESYIDPNPENSYVGDFLNMMYGKIDPTVEKAMNKLLILHADHEQNCSASSVRMVGSSKSNLYAVIGAGVTALWGELHGGANQKVLEQLQLIVDDGNDYMKYVNMAKDKSTGFRLMGFGHRVYKNFDPRATILKSSADDVLATLGKQDPLLDIAKNLEKIAIEDDYFKARKLFPNVDFYSGIIYKALEIPNEMMTVMFSLGRLPGWIAQWKEWMNDPSFRIHRPRQVFMGDTDNKWVDINNR